MNSRSALRTYLTFIALATIAQLTLVALADGKPQRTKRLPGAGSASSVQSQSMPQQQYPPAEIELLRIKLLELVDGVRDFSDSLLPGNSLMVEKLDKAVQQIAEMSPTELNRLRAGLDPSKMTVGLAEARAALADFKPALELFRQNSAATIKPASAGFPGRDDPNAACNTLVGSGKPGASVLRAADTIYFIAEGVFQVASEACDQIAVLVALGEGGGANTSLACLITDAVYYVAYGVRQALQTCEDDFSRRTVDANYSRLDHIHTDLADAVTNDNTNTTTVTTAVGSAKTAIVAT